MGSHCRVGHAAHPTQACRGPVAETGRLPLSAWQNCASANVVRLSLVHAQPPAIALRAAQAGSASGAVCTTGSAASSLGLRLTLRSSGPPTAWRPGREAVLFIIVLAARAPRCRRPLNLYVRRCPSQAVGLKALAPSCSAPPVQGRAATAPNPSAPRSGCGDRIALLVRKPEIRVHQRTSAEPRPRSNSGQRPSLCAGWPSFGARAGRGHCSFVVGAAPNSAFKRTANSVAPWPRGRGVYHRPRGQGATLSSAA